MLSVHLKRFIKILLAVLLSIGFVLHSSAFAEEIIKIGGNGTSLGTMKLLGAAFEKSRPDTRVEVLPSMGSGGGIKAVAKGAIDIGLSGRPIKDEESKLGLSVIEYARTPFIFVANKDVKVSNLSSEEIIKIFKGEMMTWPDGKRIRLILRDVYESDTLIVKKISPEMSEAYDVALSRNGLLLAMTDQEFADAIEKTAGAFGFSSLTQAITEKRTFKILFYNGVAPSTKAIAAGTYSFFKSLYMITKPAPSTTVRQFIDFVQSSEGKKIIEKSGNLLVMDRAKK